MGSLDLVSLFLLVLTSNQTAVQSFLFLVLLDKLKGLGTQGGSSKWPPVIKSDPLKQSHLLSAEQNLFRR
jgi:hypothetical protein